VLGYGTTGDGLLDAFDTNQVRAANGHGTAHSEAPCSHDAFGDSYGQRWSGAWLETPRVSVSPFSRVNERIG
jgi:hypothetical protein